MPGPPMDINHEKFQPIFLIIRGRGGRGKSTLTNALKSENSYIVHADLWFYEYFQPASQAIGFNLGIHLKSFKENDNLLNFIENKIRELPTQYKLYILESSAFRDSIIEKICSLKNFVFIVDRKTNLN